MATVGIKIFKHHKKADGTFNVKIRVTHKGVSHYLDTPHFVCEKQLKKDYSIKDVFLTKILNGVLDDYRTAIDKLHGKLDLFTSENLRDYLTDKDEPVDFIKFAANYINQLKKEGRHGSAKTLQTVQLGLIDFFNKDVVLVN